MTQQKSGGENAPRLVLATSLSPIDERDVQATTVQSWLDNDITVVAVNTAAEIDQFKSTYPNIHFVVAERTAEQYAHKPVPYIYDLLQAAKTQSSPGDTVGIINADIFLRPAPGLKQFLMQSADGCVVLGPRVDVTTADSFNVKTPISNPKFSVGYDYFIMSRDVVDVFADSPFAMGMPFWDYWLPLTAYLAGRDLKSLNSPIALHVNHETRWDETIYLFFHALIAYVMEQSKSNAGNGTAANRQLAFLLNFISHHYGFILDNGTSGKEGAPPDETAIAALADFYDRFQEAAVHTIKSNAEVIHFDAT
ncbi:MAG: hypothetical protein RIC29_08745 [Rhodospirillaceae bacterium]